MSWNLLKKPNTNGFKALSDRLEFGIDLVSCAVGMTLILMVSAIAAIIPASRSAEKKTGMVLEAISARHSQNSGNPARAGRGRVRTDIARVLPCLESDYPINTTYYAVIPEDCASRENSFVTDNSDEVYFESIYSEHHLRSEISTTSISDGPLVNMILAPSKMPDVRFIVFGPTSLAHGFSGFQDARHSWSSLRPIDGFWL